MFTSEEIRQITFEKAMRGYKAEDVESFIEKVADEFETLENEKKDLEDKLYVLAEKIEQYKADEESIKTTLINAQRLGESIIADAKAKADDIETESIKKKNNIISSAYAEIDGCEETVAKLRQEASDFKHTILGLYKEHIESLSKIPEFSGEAAEEEKAEETETADEAGTTVEFEIAEEKPAEETPAEETAETAEEASEKFNRISTLFDGE